MKKEHLYYFVLGRNPSLSFMEIESVLSGHEFILVGFSDEIVLIKTTYEIGTGVFAVLGGSVKMGKILDWVELTEDPTNLEKVFSGENLKEKYISGSAGKVRFGISFYNAGGDLKVASSVVLRLKSFSVTVKRNLSSIGISSGFVEVRENSIPSATVTKNSLLKKGAEIVLVLTNEKILFGRTLAVQDFGAFAVRDMQRPKKDKRSGIIPPKLARMMINISGVKKEGVLLDPFCGSGTILTEAVTLGIRKIIGSDISSRAVMDTRENLDWLFSFYRHEGKFLKREDFEIKVFEKDVKHLYGTIPSGCIDAVVTEPYLGPPLYSLPDNIKVSGIFSDVRVTYLHAFKAFSRLLKKGGRAVVVFPSFSVYGKIRLLDIISEVSGMGMVMLPYEGEISYQKSERGSLLYESKGQFVTREILLFEKK